LRCQSQTDPIGQQTIQQNTEDSRPRDLVGRIDEYKVPQIVARAESALLNWRVHRKSGTL
jgi:hypothetical protein